VDIPIERSEAPKSSEPAILTAIQDQLGLKLVPQLMPKEFLVIDQRSLRQTRSRWRAFEVDWRNIPITLNNSLGAVARTIRDQIRSELSLIASAGVAPNKFLAKIVSPRKSLNQKSKH
jgi:nucleotidyltransferase/DNA polymerase involved in DNA repair